VPGIGAHHPGAVAFGKAVLAHEEILFGGIVLGEKKEVRSLQRTVRVVIGAFGADSLRTAREREETHLPRSLMQAIRYYLIERDSERVAWPYPELRRGDPEPSGDGAVGVEVSLDDAVWKAFGEEAERQAVSVDRLAEHAALFFAADRDSGRLSRRILDRLAGEEA
jgi:hypothetical protein